MGASGLIVGNCPIRSGIVRARSLKVGPQSCGRVRPITRRLLFCQSLPRISLSTRRTDERSSNPPARHVYPVDMVPEGENAK